MNCIFCKSEIETFANPCPFCGFRTGKKFNIDGTDIDDILEIKNIIRKKAKADIIKLIKHIDIWLESPRNLEVNNHVIMIINDYLEKLKKRCKEKIDS